MFTEHKAQDASCPLVQSHLVIPVAIVEGGGEWQTKISIEMTWNSWHNFEIFQHSTARPYIQQRWSWLTDRKLRNKREQKSSVISKVLRESPRETSFSPGWCWNQIPTGWSRPRLSTHTHTTSSLKLITDQKASTIKAPGRTQQRQSSYLWGRQGNC